MLLVCIFIIITLGIIIVKRPRAIIWMGRYIRNKLLLLFSDMTPLKEFSLATNMMFIVLVEL